MTKEQTRAPARQKTAPPAVAGNQTSEKLVGRLAVRYGVPASALLGSLRDTVFRPPKDQKAFSDVELAAALVLCDKYDLNPFAKEIYITRNRGALLVIVPIDGWSKIANRQESYDGCEFVYADDENGGPYSTTCKIFRKDRGRATEVTEFYDECFAPKSENEMDPWRKWPRRMLRHKAFIQAVRLAFSLSEAVDDDEAHRMGAREPDYHVVEDRPEPALEQPQRQPPTEVKAPAPAEETAEEAAPGESVEAKQIRTSLIAEWAGIRKDLKDVEAAEVRKFAGVELIDMRCTLAQLEAVVRKASEIAEGKRE